MDQQVWLSSRRFSAENIYSIKCRPAKIKVRSTGNIGKLSYDRGAAAMEMFGA
ncbi:MAG: hypothetical protein K9J27_10890 [Bacteroidales bacterium]|nr:hypothetical protein [Bacteroidales bacterium]